MRFSFDTSALINPWYDLYPLDVFPRIWEGLSEAIERGIVVAQVTVIKEIGLQDDELLQWVKQQSGLEFPFDETVQRVAGDIQNKHPKLVRPNSRIGADPFVIALAKQHDLVVVSEEELTTSPSKNKGKIPYVCDDYGIPHVNFLGFMRDMGWRF
ncbi:MAG: DUF4411 family protein [Anaerolineaceae bacterium]|nr:DUF4411 family protein [Anaerolineaceae bacterium]